MSDDEKPTLETAIDDIKILRRALADAISMLKDTDVASDFEDEIAGLESAHYETRIYEEAP